MLYIHLVSFIFIHSLVTVSYAAEKLLSDPENTEESFSYAIGSHAFYVPDGRIFLTAQETVKDNAYAVAVTDRSRNTLLLTGITPKHVMLNNKEKHYNPLYGAAISHCVMLGIRPVVIKKGDSSLYCIDHFMYESNPQENPVIVTSSLPLADARGNTNGRVLALTTSAPALIEPLEGGAHQEMAAFVALANKQGTFDGNGSGIALAFFKSEKREEKNHFFWDIFNAQTGDSEYIVEAQQSQETQEDRNKKQHHHKRRPAPNGGTKKVEIERKFSSKGNKAAPLDKTTQAIKVEGTVSAIGCAVDMFYDRNLGRLYIGLDVQAGAQARDGARALILGQVVQGKLVFTPIIPDSALEGQDKIIGTRGALSHVSIHKVRTMQTRTQVRYLIVVGGNGTLSKREVFALPLVDNVKSASHGALASKNKQPVTLFGSHEPQRFEARAFIDPAQQAEDLYTTNSVESRVGSFSELPGDITDISVSDDAVFVSVAQDGDVQAGIFHSQALFDETGKINGWTEWRRTTHTAQKIQGFAYDPYLGVFTYILHGGHTVLRSMWSRGETLHPLEKFIAKEFKRSTGGVQGLFDFPYTSAGFTCNRGSRSAVTVFTGFQKVIFMQTGQDKDKSFGPSEFDKKNVYHSVDGTLALFKPGVQTLVLSGGALKELGPIVSADTVFDGTHGWFVVGGSEGIAVLAHSDGTGWRTLKSGFEGLLSHMAFKKCGSYKNVRKLVSQGNLLYILTPTTLERIMLTPEGIRTNTLESVVLAQAKKEALSAVASFSDVIISGPLALLATSDGLVRSGNGVDIRDNESDFKWTLVHLPESVGSLTKEGPVSRLFAISSNGIEKDVARGGTVWALNAHVGTLQAQVYRLALQVDSGVVTDASVHLYPDFFIKDIKTFFVDLSDYRNYIVTDGALTAVSRSAYGQAQPLFELLPPRLRNGQLLGIAKGLRMKFLNKEDHSRSIGQLVHCSGAGYWLFPGDFGIRIQG